MCWVCSMCECVWCSMPRVWYVCGLCGVCVCVLTFPLFPAPRGGGINLVPLTQSSQARARFWWDCLSLWHTSCLCSRQCVDLGGAGGGCWRLSPWPGWEQSHPPSAFLLTAACWPQTVPWLCFKRSWGAGEEKGVRFGQPWAARCGDMWAR